MANYVSPPETPGLLTQAKQPFEATPLHPNRRLLLYAGMKIERGADTDHHRSQNLAYVFRHPEFLLRSTHTHPDDVTSSLIDRAYY